MYEIVITHEAMVDLESMRKTDQQTMLSAIEKQLSQHPAEETRNRKRLRPNQTAEWELRVGPLRAFYDIETDPSVVRVKMIGLKHGSRVVVRGREIDL